uniref:Putative calcineurin-mediated signaling pathway inhibitor dscr1 n=1 Tax=Xenopsylla cheopis TaxID=163159 RepID=A0A6M2DQ21_XENCH
MAECDNIDKNMCSDDQVYINSADGLPDVHPNFEHINNDSDEELNDDDLTQELPKSIIVTNIHRDVFKSDEEKANLESLFRTFSEDVGFQWLPSFRRLRVNYTTPIAAANARIHLHQYEVEKSIINCYFAQPVTPVGAPSLRPPAPVKQFLISPPASPPLGWEPREENEPLINHDLLAALANLTPGSSHELHAPTESQPGIVVHTAQLPNSSNDISLEPGRCIPHTRCPDYN